MRKEECDQFHEVANRLSEMMREAKVAGHRELEKTLQTLCDILHSRGSGQRIDPERLKRI